VVIVYNDSVVIVYNDSVVIVYNDSVVIVHTDRLVMLLADRHHVATHNILFTLYELYRLFEICSARFVLSKTTEPADVKLVGLLTARRVSVLLHAKITEPRFTKHSYINGITTSGHYMYRTAVTICTAQWSLHVPHSGHYMYRTAVTIYTTSLTFSNSAFCPHSVFLCFVWI
jgi:hypothetical protein